MPSPDEANRYVNPATLHVPVDWIPITPGPSEFTRPLRAIRANTSGTVTVTMATEESRVLNFYAGETRFGIFLAVTAADATGLEGGV
jgi:hypothetical protein